MITPSPEPIPITFPTNLELDGFNLRVIERVGELIILEKTKPGHRHRTFEVVRVQIKLGRMVFGTWYPEREALPRSDEWGELGWTFIDLQSAKAKLKALLNPMPPTC